MWVNASSAATISRARRFLTLLLYSSSSWNLQNEFGIKEFSQYTCSPIRIIYSIRLCMCTFNMKGEILKHDTTPPIERERGERSC